MSFILDALKRSEHARRVLGATQPPPPGATEQPRRRGWTLGIVVLLLLGNAALLTWFVLRPATAPDTAPLATASGEVRSLAREAGGDERAVAGAVAPTVAARAPLATPAVAMAIGLSDADPATRARLANLHIDVHGWADDPAQRFAIINLKRRTLGEALDAGVTLVEIVPDGVVVEVDGRRVVLPRQ